MKSYYTEQKKEQIAKEFYRFQVDKSQLGTIGMLLQKIAPATDQKSEIFKFLYYGVGRRLKIMEQCVENVFAIRPIETEIFPTESERLNLTINLQCFLINLYGTLENLARVYANYIDFQGTKFDLSFFSPERIDRQNLLKTLPPDIHDAFIGDGEWLKYIKSIRDLLVHQEPFYIPPNSVNMDSEKEWRALEQEKEQILSDWLKSLLSMANNEKIRNANGIIPSIEQLNAENNQYIEIDAKRDAGIQSVKEKQQEYEVFIPMIIADTRDMQIPPIYFYEQMLLDIKMIYEKVVLILNYVEQYKKENQR